MPSNFRQLKQASNIVNLDPSIAPFNVAIQVWVPPAVTDANYTVLFTLDNLSNPDGSDNLNARWVPDPQFPPASSATITGNYAFPISAIRVDVAAGVGLELKIQQGFSIN